MEKIQERLQKWEKYKDRLTEKQFNWLNCGTPFSTWEMNNEGEIDVEGDFYCHGFKPLDNISQGYQGIRFGRIEGNFVASNIGLTSLEGSPKWVKGEFIVSHNQIKNLEHLPEYIGGNLDISNCEILSLKGIKEVNKPPTCYGNPLSTKVIINIHDEMKNKKIPYELALVQTLRKKEELEIPPEEIELLEKDLPENADLLKDVLDYSLIK